MTIDPNIKVNLNPRFKWRLPDPQGNSLRKTTLPRQRIQLSDITQHKHNCPIQTIGTSTISSRRVQVIRSCCQTSNTPGQSLHA
ncbi:hypothetical protein E1A91_A02G122000v1 [Gossypium mustelinum]|uniref:Uncharacterized protein n=3 Tax=Gossypium TaxID=3633 RepID=A0A5D3A6G1_GOSMU|nr:hypothetical protein ES288_A02G129200v1 [Gossypium darwinii]TYI39953.1 hypothetical protein ES332_A02G131200v1 [Gossypium tomentosum]TYJ46448.1 hypothetical protein E1A91_A02G122000v1 [Gossypium mustelinum]